MASSVPVSRAFSSLVWATVVAASLAAVLVAGFQFQVGGRGRGWKIPSGNEPETYNEWAAKNRFRVGDTLNFKYEKDSVLVVNNTDYLDCNTSNPISKFDDGDTIFQFDRSGLFYFISGQPGHCKSGQRLIIRVMHPSEIAAPAHAPSPAPGRDSGGSSGDGWQMGKSSAGKIAAFSCLLTSFLGVLVMAYLVI